MFMRLLAVLVSDAREVLDLADEESNCNTCCKACGDRIGNIFEQASEAAQTHDYEEDARHDRSDHEPFSAVLHYDACNDRRKSCRGSCDLDTASAKERYDESCHDRGVDTGFRSDARRYGKCN